jgi:uncharacterized phage protein gp47/JayE
MALEEVSFYNTNGDEINLTNLVDQMINFYELKSEVGETRLTDFNEGSEIRNLLEAFAILGYAIMEEQSEATRIAFISTSEDTWLDRIGELPFIDLPRIGGQPSTGSVTFTLAAALDDDYTIPSETILSSSETGLDFETDGDVTIFAGELTGTGIANCLTDGADGNVPVGSIDTIDDDSVDTEILSVTNEYPFELGLDYEDDDTYRERLLANVRADGFGSVGYYNRIGESVDGVHDVKLVSDESYTRKVLVNGKVKPTPESVLLDVLAVYSSLENLVLGHSFTVDRPEYVEVDMSFELSVSELVDEDELSAMLSAFVDGGSIPSITYTGLMIGEDVTSDNLNGVMKVFENVVDSSVTISEHTINDGDVLKLGDVSFTQTVVD